MWRRVLFLFLILSFGCTTNKPELYGKWKLVKSEYQKSGKTIPSSQFQGTVEAIFSTDGTFTTLFQGKRLNFFPYTYDGENLEINGVKTDYYFREDTLYLVTDKSQGIVDIYTKTSPK